MQVAGAALIPVGSSPRRWWRRPRTISWSGESWIVRPARWRGLPGPNLWSAGNAAVEGENLLLAIARSSRGWTCAEIESSRSFGYGRYEFVVNSDLSRLDPWVVLGLFTYDGEIPRPHNEIDIEVAKWGHRRDRTNAEFVLQRARNRGAFKGFRVPPHPPYTMWWEWTQRSIVWGVTDATGEVVSTWARRTDFEPAGEHVHLNLWLAEGHPPARPLTIEIASFRHTPV
jgi:hypothetical protein